MSAPRIDTLRNQIARTVELIEMCGLELEDLHVLAYERRVASSERVRTSNVDYGLDTHGDPKAREAYRRLAGALIASLEPIANAAQDVTRLMTDGRLTGTNGDYPRTIKAAEHANAIRAQARRIERGDYTPHRTWPQPKVGS